VSDKLNSASKEKLERKRGRRNQGRKAGKEGGREEGRRRTKEKKGCFIQNLLP
jgi:hypothetical protein